MKTGLRSLAGLVLTFFILSNVGSAADWPQYKRNSARTGDAPDEVLKFPMQRVVAVRLPSPIYASPAVVGGKVYVQDARGNVVCVDAKSNKVLWTMNIGGVANHSSPAVSGGRVFIGSSAGHLAILDAKTGKLIKKVPADGGVIAAPAVEKDNIYFSTTNGKLVKINRDGKVVWTFQGGRASYVEFAVRNGEILFLGGPDKKIGRSGSRLVPYKGPQSVVHDLLDEGPTVRLRDSLKLRNPTGGPAFGDGSQAAIQTFDTENGVCYVIERDAKGKRKARKLLPHRFNDSRVALSYRKGRFYRGDVCASPLPADRKRVPAAIWKTESSVLGYGMFHSSPALAKDHLAVGSEAGKVYFLPLGEKLVAKRRGSHVQKPAWTFATLSAGKPNGAVSSSPAISGGQVFFGGEDGILYGLGQGQEAAIAVALPQKAYEPRAWPGAKLKGHEWHTLGGDMGYSSVSPDTKMKPPFRIKWKTRVWGVMKNSVVVAEGKVFLGARMGQVTALDAESGEIIWRTYHPSGESCHGTTYADGKLLVLRSGKNQHRTTNKNGGVWCHDAKTGKKLWYKPISRFGYQYNNADGVAVQDGKVLACWNGGGGAIKVAAYALKDGTEVWKRRHEGALDKDGTISDSAFRFSTSCGEGKFYLSVCAPIRRKGKKRAENTGTTMALDPGTGKVLWKNDEYVPYGRGRNAFRKGTLVVFGEKGGHALDPKTGKHLWTGAGAATVDGVPAPPQKVYFLAYHLQALTDLYLESKGQRGVMESHTCTWSAYANGVWYGHYACFGPHLAGRVEIDGQAPATKPDKKRSPRKAPARTKVVWMYTFNSRACPTPAPAYGRLYYSPNGEGVVYCFEPAAEGAGRRKR